MQKTVPIEQLTTYTTPSNHYSMLASLQEMWQLRCLQRTCDTANVVPANRLFSVN